MLDYVTFFWMVTTEQARTSQFAQRFVHSMAMMHIYGYVDGGKVVMSVGLDLRATNSTIVNKIITTTALYKRTKAHVIKHERYTIYIELLASRIFGNSL